ncbi:beta-1,4-galactosyltransferase 1-like [Planococcus citri]|uniref:beta-1,4-galactosyltransferase 1-like n=1 Tax=Planococcus citri TaxID=170843 RepID=UPI0031F9550C
MSRINILGLILRHHKFKLFLLFLTLLVLFNTLLYTQFFTVFEVIPQNKVLSNLVADKNRNSTLVNCTFHTFDSSRLHYPDINVPDDLNSWAKKLNISKGEWKPHDCTALFYVAIIIPYRNREEHLKIFLYNIHPFLQKQNVHYRIYVIEQSDPLNFNRGKLFNIGYIEALKDHTYPCFIFHDIDLLPQNYNNIYACTRYPRHMSSSIDKFRYQVPYDRNFGGVTAILSEQYRQVNGFANSFYGWGGEDDDFFNRVRISSLRVSRFAQELSRYASLPHKLAEPTGDRFDKLNRGVYTYSKDGLNSLSYQVASKSFNMTHVHVSVYT